MQRILVIDDQPQYLEAHMLALKEAGYALETAVNETDAIAELSSLPPPSLIILDIILPYSITDIGQNDGMTTGVRLLERIRKELLLMVPIIVLTVQASPLIHGSIQRIERDFNFDPIILVKPFPPSALLEEVQFALAKAKPGGSLQ